MLKSHNRLITGSVMCLLLFTILASCRTATELPQSSESEHLIAPPDAKTLSSPPTELENLVLELDGLLAPRCEGEWGYYAIEMEPSRTLQWYESYFYNHRWRDVAEDLSSPVPPLSNNWGAWYLEESQKSELMVFSLIPYYVAPTPTPTLTPTATLEPGVTPTPEDPSVPTPTPSLTPTSTPPKLSTYILLRHCSIDTTEDE
jgi:hypothetical protein